MITAKGLKKLILHPKTFIKDYRNKGKDSNMRNIYESDKNRKVQEIVFIRNGLTGGGLGLMCALQANYFYSLGYDVTILTDQAYDEKLLSSFNAKLFNHGIKILPMLTSENRLYQTPHTTRRADKTSWFGGTISEYFDEYGVLIKKAFHDSKRQRVKITIPLMEKYLNSLKDGDVVIAMEASLGWYLGNIKLKNNISKVFQFHNQHFFNSNHWIDNMCNYNAIVFQTKKTLEVYTSMYGTQKNAYIIGNPLQQGMPEEQKIIPHSKRPLKMVFVGRFEEGKQPLDAIKAFEIVKKSIPEAYLEFYGSGKLQDEMKAYINTNNLESSIYIKGFEKIHKKIFSDAALMIFPTKKESFGMVIIESFSYGTPVVAYTTTVGVDDLVINNQNGYIANQGNFEQLAEFTINLLQNVDLRDKMMHNCGKMANNFEYNKIMEEYKSLILNNSCIKVNQKNLYLNILERMNIPNALKNYIVKFSINEINEIIKLLNQSKAKIINGQAYIYNKNLVEKCNIPLSLFKIN